MSEVNNSPASNKGSWQDAIDPGFQERLMRPLVKPGVIDKAQLAGNILSRSERFANRLPLVSQLERRFSGVNNLPASQLPIAYAQPLSSEAKVANTSTASGSSPTSGRVSRAIVQAKFAPTPSKSTSASLSAIATVRGIPVANSTRNFSSSVEESSSPLPLVRSQNAEPTQVKQKPASNSPSTQSNIRTDATKAPKPQPVVSSQDAESMQVQQTLDLIAPSTAQNSSVPSGEQPSLPVPVARSQSVEPISTPPNLDLIAPSTAQNSSVPSGEQPSLPVPVARSQSVEPISTPQKQDSAQLKSLPIVYAEPLTGEVGNPSKSLTLANSQPLQTQVNPLPVVQPKYSRSQQTTRSQNPTTASLTPSSIPQTTENNSQPTSETNSSIPIVQVTNTVRSWLEPQPHPLLKNQTTANPTPNQTFNQKTVRTTNLGTPLIFSTPHSATAQGQQANNSDFTSSQQHFDGGQTNYNSATTITAASQQVTPNSNRPPAVESDRSEGNNLPNNNSPTKIDVDALADKVERKLMRRLVIENERRGQTRWR